MESRTWQQVGGTTLGYIEHETSKRLDNRAYIHVITLDEFKNIITKMLNDTENQKDKNILNIIHKKISKCKSNKYDDGNYVTFDHDSDIEYFIHDDAKYHDYILEHIKSRNYMDLKRGDIVAHEFLGYRNSGRLIYTGEKIIDLSDEHDDYGNVPKEFKAITEFEPNYWCDRIYHNFYIWLDLDNETIKEQLTIDNFKPYRNSYKFDVIYNDKIYKIIYSSEVIEMKWEMDDEKNNIDYDKTSQISETDKFVMAYELPSKEYMYNLFFDKKTYFEYDDENDDIIYWKNWKMDKHEDEHVWHFGCIYHADKE